MSARARERLPVRNSACPDIRAYRGPPHPPAGVTPGGVGGRLRRCHVPGNGMVGAGWGGGNLRSRPRPFPSPLSVAVPPPTSPQCQPPGTASLKPGVVFSPLLGPSGSQNSCLDKSATRYMPKLDVSTPSSLHTQIRFPQALAAVLPTHVTNGFRSW